QGSSPGELVQACLGPTAPGDVSGAKFHSALQEIYTQNGLVDRDFANRCSGKRNPDFYSHSNWVELGYTEPYDNLIRPDQPLENLAKCSHGGASDLTSTVIPRGGINKDERRQDNKAFHDAAVKAAIAASLHLLDDICLAAGNRDFLMMGIARSSVVCFVIDTTGSMSEDIEEARAVVYKIIDSKKGTQDEPSEYILVPFNDPFGPIIRTSDAEKMKTEISKLKATGGGDTPEMCLSGLQMALTGAPSSSNIYVFTDATAKDIALKDTIIALIRRTKSTVSFFMTSFSSRRRRRSLGAASFSDYMDLALASGGQAIQVSKSQLPQATDIILDTSTSALVTVFQRAVTGGGLKTFIFVLDESLKSITIYITGTSLTFTLTNPAVTQSNNEASGKLGTIQTVGNLWRFRLNADKQSGDWTINIQS
uniref:von Willebrand factor A domain containing 11 n=1 Tax=Fundulus heteroclitus TaxID=8078 RepID=A0A3Q2PIE1_FUNHE